MDTDHTERTSSLQSFRKDLGKWISHYENDGNYGKDFCEMNAIRQVLLPINLNGNCIEIVDFLWSEYKKPFALWLKDHDETLEFLKDDNDPRIIEISKIGQEKFREAGIDYKKLGSF